MSEQRHFPLQPARRGYPGATAPLSIPWSVAERAYGAYASMYGRGQSLERLAERGGFGVEEMDQLYPPWREEVSEIAALRAAVAMLRARDGALETADRWISEGVKKEQALCAEVEALRARITLLENAEK